MKCSYPSKCFNSTLDVDECASNTDNCSANAACKNTIGSFSCTCNSGYQGNGYVCNGMYRVSRISVLTPSQMSMNVQVERIIAARMRHVPIQLARIIVLVIRAMRETDFYAMVFVLLFILTF